MEMPWNAQDSHLSLEEAPCRPHVGEANGRIPGSSPLLTDSRHSNRTFEILTAKMDYREFSSRWISNSAGTWDPFHGQQPGPHNEGGGGVPDVPVHGTHQIPS